MEEINRAFLTPMQDPAKAPLFRKGAASFRTLTGDEQMVIASFWQSLFLICQESHILHQNGSIDDDLAATMETFMVSAIQVPGVAEWWEESAPGHSPSFQNYVARLRASNLEIAPLTQVWSWFSEASRARG